MTKIYNFKCLCVCTLGLALIGYLGYRLVVWIGQKMGCIKKIDEVATQVLSQQNAPILKPIKASIILSNEQRIAKLVTDHLFDEMLGKEKEETDFSYQFVKDEVVCKEGVPVKLHYVEKGQKAEISLTTLFNNISWSRLDPKWNELSDVQVSKVLKENMNYSYFNTRLIIRYYTSMNQLMGYYHLNKFLRNSIIPSYVKDVDQGAKFQLFVSLALSASIKDRSCPRIGANQLAGRVVRLSDAVVSTYQPGKEITEVAFTSATIKAEFLNTFGSTKNVIFYITPKLKSRGRLVQNFSLTPHEAECLFLPGTKFRVDQVTSSEKNGCKKHHIKMSEV